MAARAGQADVVRYLLKNGAKVETKSKVGDWLSPATQCWGDCRTALTPNSVPPAGRPNGAAHRQSAGEGRHRAAAAAKRRLCQRRHHLGLHAASPGRPRGTPGCGRHAAGEWRLALLLHQGQSGCRSAKSLVGAGVSISRVRKFTCHALIRCAVKLKVVNTYRRSCKGQKATLTVAEEQQQQISAGLGKILDWSGMSVLVSHIIEGK